MQPELLQRLLTVQLLLEPADRLLHRFTQRKAAAEGESGRLEESKRESHARPNAGLVKEIQISPVI